ncbi:MAG TPA: hypothetical protein VFB16_10275 [Bauldia sp.]|nr:hypothetical protein [Bauldia sp.]
MKVVIVDCNYTSQRPHPVFVEMKRRLANAGVELLIDSGWSDDYATADLIIGADPIRDRPSLSDARLLGQRTLNRRERLEVAKAAGAPVARFGAPRSEDELTALGREWGTQQTVLKYDWSSRRNGVFLWPLGEGRQPLPADFNPQTDVCMEFLDGDPRTFKADLFAGCFLFGWILATRDMRNTDWQVVEENTRERAELPADLIARLDAAGDALLAHGVGYCSFDLMNGPEGFRIIEINTSGVGTSIWNFFPNEYAASYARAILRTLGRLPAVPLFRELREQARAAGSDASAPALPERDAVGRARPRAKAAVETGASSEPAAQVPADLAFFRNLTVTEKMAPAQLLDAVRRPLEALVRHAWRTAPLYRDRLQRLFNADGTIAWSRWEELPFTSRDDVRDRRQALLSREPPVGHGATTFVHTAGSVGAPVSFSRTRLAVAVQTVAQTRLYAWNRLHPPFPMVTTLRGAQARRAWVPAFVPEPHGPLLICPTPVAKEAVTWLAGLGDVYLQTLPSHLRALAIAAAETGVRPKLAGILATGEVLTDDLRGLAVKHFGLNPLDSYGLTETGLLAVQCPAGDGLHLQCELCRIEVLNERGLACRPGETGEVVATPLFNLAMPLIRYRTDDMVVMADSPEGVPCACGRTLPKIKRVLGRRRNLLRFPGMAPMQPEVDSETMWKMAGTDEWQIAQTKPYAVEVRVGLDAGVHADTEPLLDYIRKRVPQGVTVGLASRQRTSLRLASGKLENIVCEII